MLTTQPTALKWKREGTLGSHSSSQSRDPGGRVQEAACDRYPSSAPGTWGLCSLMEGDLVKHTGEQIRLKKISVTSWAHTAGWRKTALPRPPFYPSFMNTCILSPYGQQRLGGGSWWNMLCSMMRLR